VELSASGEQYRPIVGYASDANVKVTVLLMACKRDERTSHLCKAEPKGKAAEALEKARKELEAANANAGMWKAKALKLEEEEEKFGKDVAAANSAQVEELQAEVKKWHERFRKEKAERVKEKGEHVEDGKLKELEKQLEEQAKRIAELNAAVDEKAAELKARNDELDRVWRENESLKRKDAKAIVGTASDGTKVVIAETHHEDMTDVETVTLETMQAWCEGKNLVATQKRAGTCIWIQGESEPWKDELKELGFRFSPKRKSWYLV
jgi:uncharacterized coiled-coil protein SlyX